LITVAHDEKPGRTEAGYGALHLGLLENGLVDVVGGIDHITQRPRRRT
jgi:hypothetical protein